MIQTNNLTIKRFQPEDQDLTKALILAGLEEHWGFIDLTKNPDLDDINTHYAAGIFLLAWLDDELVGSGGLIPEEVGVGRIVRMSVANHLRRRGIGRMILLELNRAAKEAGYQQLVLETTETWHDVVAFYQQQGFQTTGYQGGDRHFKLELI